jgi:thioredoxin-related protein
MRRIEVTALALLLLLGVSAAQAAELVMFRRDGCPWCLAWDRDIGPIYHNTDIGRIAPLRFADIKRKPEDVALARPVRYTPTFVLVEAGREAGRIEGYPGEDFFWARLERLVQDLPARPPSSRQPSAARSPPMQP